MDSLEHAQLLVAYFRRLTAKHPGDEDWRLGLAGAERWLALIGDSAASAGDAVALLKELRSDPGRGSGWNDLTIGVTRWARVRFGGDL